METFSSVNALLDENETLDFFFLQLRSKISSYVKRWNSFLDNLSISINNIHLVLNREFILGEHLSPFLTEEDIETLHEKVKEKSAFPSNDPFIYISRSPENGVPTGAAIPFVQ
ncbi:hypothetical protein ACN6MY_11560 [Peribacillus sp. B-H-3]|uniref:hypothetical protein n=1 Tax=Peribacillus sp. B-H-3 TaxID=3400420 RepID=UPI003B025322